jgi:uncharacterized protein
MDKIIRLAMDGAGEASRVAADRLVSGDGLNRTWNAWSGPGKTGHFGHWAAGVITARVRYTEAELCMILSGRVRLEAGGQSEEFGPGDAFVVEPGFEGVWVNLEPVTKIYAIVEP